MNDEAVREALHSDARLVIIEAPAGCGKTHQGAEYARQVGGATKGRLLILTHTHAACSMFADRTKGVGSRLEIRTIDSVIGQVAAAYHSGLGIPSNPAVWARQHNDGHAKLAVKVVTLLKNYPMITATLARRYPVVVCDEHQDSSGDQHAFAVAMLEQGSKLRIFADPMQNIFKKDNIEGVCAPYDWEELKGEADRFATLDVPHRWRNGCPELGEWTLRVREALKSGGKVNLKEGLPRSVIVVIAENAAQRNLEYRITGSHRKPVDNFESAQSSLLVLTRYNDTARSLRAFFNRRIQLWEGHTRGALENLTDAVASANGDPGDLAAAVVEFLGKVGKGFSRSGFGDRLEQEAREGCARDCRGKPATLQELARFIVSEPNHHGISKLLRRLFELKNDDATFREIEMDCHREFWDAVAIGGFASMEDGLAEITRRRTYSRPKPSDKAISIIHKAKGLECDSAIVIPCDARTFKDTKESRCLLYVAISRARRRLMLVVSRDAPSPLLVLP
ncbi:MAG: UvrD-helicase domain-containing protein [Bryobacteraceae bacterium]|nr:UvrD-helicase domain-containing protein [Bryobacteraceae bacterium]